MKDLPASVTRYKQTPVFDEATVPAGLLRSHNTKEGIWAKIVVLEGTLIYRILEPTIEEIELTPLQFGVIEPRVKHEVVPVKGVRFYIEFNRLAK